MFFDRQDINCKYALYDHRKASAVYDEKAIEQERRILNRLHDEMNMPWRSIAKIERYKDIPPGSLCSFAQGADLADEYADTLWLKKYKSLFDIPGKKLLWMLENREEF